MVEQVLPGLYRIELPLPRNPLKLLNCYVLTSPDRSLIIDSGFNRPECRAALETGLAWIGVDLARADWFITHMHADHIGQVGALAAPDARIYFNAPEMTWFRDRSASWDGIFSYALANGFPQSEVSAMQRGHPGLSLVAPFDIERLISLADGDSLAVGEYRLQVVSTPGHTQGHLCLYEADKRLLFSGDHVLRDITPNLQLFTDEWDALSSYLESLERVRGLAVDRVLPGHRSLFSDLSTRVDELERHHEQRCTEVGSILAAGPQSAYQVASRMTWDIRAESWEAFPTAQKWFAVGEALAHLRYLVGKGSVLRRSPNGQTVYAGA